MYAFRSVRVTALLPSKHSRKSFEQNASSDTMDIISAGSIAPYCSTYSARDWAQRDVGSLPVCPGRIRVDSRA